MQGLSLLTPSGAVCEQFVITRPRLGVARSGTDRETTLAGRGRRGRSRSGA
jgi:hypothetical protein